MGSCSFLSRIRGPRYDCGTDSSQLRVLALHKGGQGEASCRRTYFYWPLTLGLDTYKSRHPPISPVILLPLHPPFFRPVHGHLEKGIYHPGSCLQMGGKFEILLCAKTRRCTKPLKEEGKS